MSQERINPSVNGELKDADSVGSGSSHPIRFFLQPSLILGFNAQVIQLILFREALILSNGSELSLGICLAVWALFNGAGALMGWLLHRLKLDVGRWFLPMLACLPLLLGASIVCARVARACVDLPGSEPLPMIDFSLLSLMVLAPATFVDGLLFFAALEKLFGKKAGGEGTSRVYGVVSLGALVGGMLFSLVLVTVMTAFSMAGLLLLLNALFLLMHRSGIETRRSKFRWISGSILLACGALAVIAGSDLNRWAEHLRWKVLQPDLEWIESRETPYQNLAVLRYEDEYSVFANSHLLYSLRARAASKTGDWERALFPNFAMLQPEAPKQVLLIGGGTKGFLNDLLEYEPATLYWVEFDQALIELAARYQVSEEREARNSERVVFEETDGRLFVKSLEAASLDLIVVDVPDPSNANVNRYYTKEFFEECRDALRVGGVLALGLSSQPNYIGEHILQRNGSVYAALKTVFPHVRITPGTFSFLVAGRENARPTVDAEELLRRYVELGLESDRFSPFLFYTFFEESAQEWIDALYEKSLVEGALELNIDDRPVAYQADSRLAAAITGHKPRDGETGLWEKLISGDSTRDPSLLFLVLGGGLLGGGAILCLLARRKRPGRPGDHAGKALYFSLAFITGFSGIVFEVALLIAYQNHAGHLYSRMGVLIACYMAGLSAGALWRGKDPTSQSSFALAMAFILVGWGGAIILTSGLGGWLAGEFISLTLFALANFLFGAAGGLSFRGVSLALKRMGTPGGGLIYFFDIVGTFVGGWLAGSRLIPCFGIRMTLTAAGVLIMAYCLFGCLISMRRD